MKNVIAAARAVLADLKQLQIPTVASAVAGVLVPIIAAIAGVPVTAAEVGGWLIIAGGVAATLEKLTATPAKPAPAPAPAPVAVKKTKASK